MKKLFLTLALIITSIAMFAQDFDVFVTNMNGYTKGYSNNQVADLYYNHYGVPVNTLNGYYSDFGNNWGNVALGLELSRILGVPVPDIFGVYREGQSNGQGWGVMAKRYGIKPGSPAFHRMKNSMNKSHKTWGGIFGDYGKNKDAKIAKRGGYIFDDGRIKSNGNKLFKSKGNSGNNAKMKSNANNGNKGKGNNGNKGNRGKGNNK